MQETRKMPAYTKSTKEKLEELFQSAGYRVRYEKGNFQAGYCLVKDQKVIVVNKYFDLEGRIETLLNLIPEIEVDEKKLELRLQRFYKQLLHGLSDQSKLDQENLVINNTMVEFIQNANFSSEKEHQDE